MMRLIALILLAAPVAAQESYDGTPDYGRAMVERMAETADADGDGRISYPEVDALAKAVFPSIDADGDGAVTRDEMVGWEYGFADLAAFRGRDEAFRATVNVVFDIFDRDDDGRVTPSEHVAAAAHSARYADRDGDGTLSREEYLSGFIFNIAMRNALVR
ncbi:hypothetical protein JQC91_08665 [Jannaschia sp. Os4]|uniref:EF-hand domain-containing protein n=1 Tax=Jannaschia sp. Os4 TaxID=2807617 RepID=UPI00193947D2|nr:hypothetical protein [Jannaschia sp. Os4]MBM2576378.1 hypothetical protein [Jannaschia sp. Os4]